MAGMLIIDGIKVGHLVHVTGACLGAILMWLILAIIGMYQVGTCWTDWPDAFAPVPVGSIIQTTLARPNLIESKQRAKGKLVCGDRRRTQLPWMKRWPGRLALPPKLRPRSQRSC